MVTQDNTSSLVTMDAAPEIVAGRTFLPISWIAKAFGYNAAWDEATQSVMLSTVYALTTVNMPSGTDVIESNFSWQYGGQLFSWTIDTPDILMQYEGVDQIPDLQRLQDNYSRLWSLMENDPSQLYSNLVQQAINNMVTDKTSNMYVEIIADGLDNAAKQQGYNSFQEAEFIASFVQSIKYTIVSYNMEYPPQTITNGGDCINKSILLAAILNQLGYQVGVLLYPQAGHATTGIVFSDNELPSGRPYSLTYYSYDGLNYYVTETTAPGWGNRSVVFNANRFSI